MNISKIFLATFILCFSAHAGKRNNHYQISDTTNQVKRRKLTDECNFEKVTHFSIDKKRNKSPILQVHFICVHNDLELIHNESVNTFKKRFIDEKTAFNANGYREALHDFIISIQGDEEKTRWFDFTLFHEKKQSYAKYERQFLKRKLPDPKGYALLPSLGTYVREQPSFDDTTENDNIENYDVENDGIEREDALVFENQSQPQAQQTEADESPVEVTELEDDSDDTSNTPKTIRECVEILSDSDDDLALQSQSSVRENIPVIPFNFNSYNIPTSALNLGGEAPPTFYAPPPHPFYFYTPPSYPHKVAQATNTPFQQLESKASNEKNSTLDLIKLFIIELSAVTELSNYFSGIANNQAELHKFANMLLLEMQQPIVFDKRTPNFGPETFEFTIVDAIALAYHQWGNPYPLSVGSLRSHRLRMIRDLPPLFRTTQTTRHILRAHEVCVMLRELYTCDPSLFASLKF